MSEPTPNPGSDEAVALGCLCPRMDNAYGKGYMCIPGKFWINESCLLHGPTVTRMTKDTSLQFGTGKTGMVDAK